MERQQEQRKGNSWTTYIKSWFTTQGYYDEHLERVRYVKEFVSQNRTK